MLDNYNRLMALRVILAVCWLASLGAFLDGLGRTGTSPVAASLGLIAVILCGIWTTLFHLGDR